MCSTYARQLLQNINKVYLEFLVENLIFFTLKSITTKNSGGNMYESFGLIGIQLPEKYKEYFDVSSEGG